MPYITLAPGTTWCPDTPQNRAAYQRLLRNLLEPESRRYGKAGGESVAAALARATARENKELRGLRAYLPGCEPDR